MAHVDATWVGSFGLTTPDGTQLVPGVTVCNVPEGEAIASDNWQPVVAEPSKKKDKTPSGDDE